MVLMVAFLCVVGLVAGQILFKMTASSLAQAESIFTYKTAYLFVSAMAIYGGTSLAWVWLLQKTELGRVYPMMALGFVLVPLFSYLVFDERFHTQYYFGVALIVVGVVVAVRA